MSISGLLATSSLSMIASLCSIGVSICTMLAIGFDCKAKNVKSRTAYMVLAFFFPVIVAIVYLCNKNKYNMAAAEQEIPNREKDAKSGKICTILAIIFMVASITCSGIYAASMVKTLMSADLPGDLMQDLENLTGENFFDDTGIRYGFNVDGKTVYYDMNGKAYENSAEVPFYDKDGNAYTYTIDNKYNEYLVDATGKKIDYYLAFVGADGYVVFDETNSFGINDDLDYVDTNGNVCYTAYDVSWDADGNMIYSYDGSPIK